VPRHRRSHRRRRSLAPKSNRNTNNKRLSDVDLWLINRLKKEGPPVVFPIIVTEYAKERGISEKSARRILERRLKLLIEKGIIERLSTYPISYKLKRLPIEFFAQISLLREASDQGFDLSQALRMSETLVKRLVVLKKIDSSRPSLKILRKMGLRVITRANEYRRQALLRAQNKPSIKPGTTPHADIAFLYKENIRWWENSVLVFKDDLEQYLLMDVRTRFTDHNLVERVYKKARKALENGFSKHKDAIMITLTIPHIFPLVIALERKGKIIGFIPLQDSIISQLKKEMLAWIRKMWGSNIAQFTAYEYHKDYNLHLHIIIFGIPYLIDWSRKFGKKKEDALTYYVRKYKIELPPEAEKSQISKHIFTALLDKWLTRILTRLGSVLQINLLEAYLNYKKKHNLQGPVNEIHKIRDGKWDGQPPSDAIISYSSGAAYQKVLSPDDYVTKYLLKIYSMLTGGGGGIDEENQAKTYGYWLFGKRFNSYSRSLSPWKKFPKLTKLHFVGVFNKLDLPDYILEREVEW
jgi:DNA-binding Lrp family transcriptional regulator